MESFKLEGTWWLPDSPDNRISGTLRYDPKEGAHLELIGSFSLDIGLRSQSKVPNQTIILGSSVNGKAITLYKCYEKSFKINFPGLPRSVFFANVIFIGYHFDTEEKILFDEIAISFSDLSSWVSISGFKNEVESFPDIGKHKLSFIYETPKDISLELGDTEIRITFRLDVQAHRFSAINLTQKVFIVFKPTSAIDFLTYFDGMVKGFRDFLSFALGRATYFDDVIGKSKLNMTKLDDGKIVQNEIRIYLRSTSLTESSRTFDAMDMMFTYNDVADELGICLRNWFQKYPTLGPTYGLFLGSLYNPSIYLDHEFLSLAQALESYHRRTLGGKYISDETYLPQYNAFLDAIDSRTGPDFKESLKGKLTYLNEYSLSKRMKDLRIIFNEYISVILKPDDPFIADICNTRNYLTHYDERLSSLAKSGEDLYWLVEKMRAMLSICLLAEIEMPPDKIKSLLTRKNKHIRLLNN